MGHILNCQMPSFDSDNKKGFGATSYSGDCRFVSFVDDFALGIDYN